MRAIVTREKESFEKSVIISLCSHTDFLCLECRLMSFPCCLTWKTSDSSLDNPPIVFRSSRPRSRSRSNVSIGLVKRRRYCRSIDRKSRNAGLRLELREIVITTSSNTCQCSSAFLLGLLSCKTRMFNRSIVKFRGQNDCGIRGSNWDYDEIMITTIFNVSSLNDVLISLGGTVFNRSITDFGDQATATLGVSVGITRNRGHESFPLGDFHRPIPLRGLAKKQTSRVGSFGYELDRSRMQRVREIMKKLAFARPRAQLLRRER